MFVRGRGRRDVTINRAFLVVGRLRGEAGVSSVFFGGLSFS